ncbi:response regulator transcription factor [bacterium]|nr:response regulator transcription factor [bacterium]
MIRILIADDHPYVRKGLKQILDETSDIKVGGEAATGQEALERLSAGQWDVLVLDLTMPGRSGLDILHDLKKLYPKLPVLVLSMHSENEFAIRVLRAGAAGYLTKESAPDELIRAIRKIYNGGKYISAAIAEKIARDFNTDLLPHERLSDREFQIMKLIAKGQSLKSIGEELSLSPKTITTYRTRILEKMQLSTNAEIVQYVIHYHLI